MSRVSVSCSRLGSRSGVSKKLKLLPPRPGRLRFQRHGHNWMVGAEIFQMGLEEAEQQLNRVGRIGNLKAMLVARFIRLRESVLWRIGESEAKDQLLGDKVKRAESPGELFEKSLQDEEERLGRFDFVLEIDLLRKDFWLA